MDRYVFDMTTFVTSTEEQDVVLSPQTQNEVAAMQEHYPELSLWSRFAFFCSLGSLLTGYLCCQLGRLADKTT